MTDELLEAQHERLQGHLIFSFAFVVLGLVGKEVVESFNPVGPWDISASVVLLIGCGWFVVALMRLRNLGTVTEKGDFYVGIFDDERVRDIRSQAFSFGLMAVIVLQVLMLIGNVVIEQATTFSISTELAINLTIGTAVIASLARFKYLNRDA